MFWSAVIWHCFSVGSLSRRTLLGLPSLSTTNYPGVGGILIRDFLNHLAGLFVFTQLEETGWRRVALAGPFHEIVPGRPAVASLWPVAIRLRGEN